MSHPQTILVTGGAGYIGSHTVVELLQHGYRVIVLDNLSNSRIEVLDSMREISGQDFTFIRCDLTDSVSIANMLAPLTFDAVIHFAAFKAVGESVEQPLLYYRNNILGLLNLLESCREKGVKHLVFSSSCSVYGDSVRLPIAEDTPLQRAQSPYANTKKIGEDILRDLSASTDFSCIALRYFNPVGAHPSHLIGEYPIGTPLNLFPVVTQTGIGKRKEMQVFGTDYPTPDGSCVRDYIHVVDIAKAHVKALSRLMNGEQKKRFELFNLGTGKGLSVLQIIEAFKQYTGVPLPYTCVDRRPGDIAQVYADTTLANSALGWTAEKDLKEMILSAWAWEKSLQAKAVNAQ